MKEVHDEKGALIWQFIGMNPGCLTTETVKGTVTVAPYVRTFLKELEDQGRGRRVVGGTPRKPNTRWFLTKSPVSQITENDNCTLAIAFTVVN